MRGLKGHFRLLLSLLLCSVAFMSFCMYPSAALPDTADIAVSRMVILRLPSLLTLRYALSVPSRGFHSWQAFCLLMRYIRASQPVLLSIFLPILLSFLTILKQKQGSVSIFSASWHIFRAPPAYA